jgi:plasmid stabilization system protein ParE
VRLRYTLPALAGPQRDPRSHRPHSPQGARRVQARIRALTDLLLQHPNIGRPHERSGNPPDDDHALPLSGFYEASDTEIIVHAVRHAARDPSGMPGSA